MLKSYSNIIIGPTYYVEKLIIIYRLPEEGQCCIAVYVYTYCLIRIRLYYYNCADISTQHGLWLYNVNKRKLDRLKKISETIMIIDEFELGALIAMFV